MQLSWFCLWVWTFDFWKLELAIPNVCHRGDADGGLTAAWRDAGPPEACLKPAEASPCFLLVKSVWPGCDPAVTRFEKMAFTRVVALWCVVACKVDEDTTTMATTLNYAVWCWSQAKIESFNVPLLARDELTWCRWKESNLQSRGHKHFTRTAKLVNIISVLHAC